MDDYSTVNCAHGSVPKYKDRLLARGSGLFEKLKAIQFLVNTFETHEMSAPKPEPILLLEVIEPPRQNVDRHVYWTFRHLGRQCIIRLNMDKWVNDDADHDFPHSAMKRISNVLKQRTRSRDFDQAMKEVLKHIIFNCIPNIQDGDPSGQLGTFADEYSAEKSLYGLETTGRLVVLKGPLGVEPATFCLNPYKALTLNEISVQAGVYLLELPRFEAKNIYLLRQRCGWSFDARVDGRNIICSFLGANCGNDIKKFIKLHFLQHLGLVAVDPPVEEVRGLVMSNNQCIGVVFFVDWTTSASFSGLLEVYRNTPQNETGDMELRESLASQLETHIRWFHDHDLIWNPADWMSNCQHSIILSQAAGRGPELTLLASPTTSPFAKDGRMEELFESKRRNQLMEIEKITRVLWGQPSGKPP